MNTQQKASISCYSCHKGLDLGEGQKILKNEECPYCYASLHCCKMCHFYEPQAYNECKETNAERIVDKEKANYCDYFLLKGQAGGQDQKKDDLLAQAQSLFKD